MKNGRKEHPPRRLVCAACGAAFTCTLDSDCWCNAETTRLPLPPEPVSAGEDCLCPACLRARSTVA